MDEEDEPDLKTIPAAILPSSLTNLPVKRQQLSGPLSPMPETMQDDDVELTAGSGGGAYLDDFTDTGTRKRSSLWSVLIGLLLAIALFGTLAYLFRPQSSPEPVQEPAMTAPAETQASSGAKGSTSQEVPVMVAAASAPAAPSKARGAATTLEPATSSPAPEVTVSGTSVTTTGEAGAKEASEAATTTAGAGPGVEADEASKAGTRSTQVIKRRKRRAVWPEPEVTESTERATSPGTLSLVTEPVAHVYFKAQDMGMTPLSKVNLPPGQHVLRLSSELGVRFLSVEVKSAKETVLRVSLDDLVPEP
jgi:eukaryotic-like serine/threonine-protein kinase